MSRRPGNFTRRNSNSLAGVFPPKSRPSPLLSVIIFLLGALLMISYYRSSGGYADTNAISKVEGDFGCTYDVHKAILVLKKTYGNSMHKVLHVGPDSCLIVSQLVKEDEIEAWGVDPYDIEDADMGCQYLVRKGLVRVADIKFPLPYRPKSFSLIIVSDAVDYLSTKHLNKTLPDLARLSANNLVVFTGYPGNPRAKIPHLSKFGRPAKMRSASWWARFFLQTSLKENEAAVKKFEQAAYESSYKPRCQVFHLTKNG